METLSRLIELITSFVRQFSRIVSEDGSLKHILGMF